LEPLFSSLLIEEALFARRRSLFSDLSVVLFDTTSLTFYGAGGESLGQRGKSKDHRPDLRQVVVGVVLDAEGRPICSETWPGNATDVTALLPVTTRLRERFGIARICVVADRGMISAETMAGWTRGGCCTSWAYASARTSLCASWCLIIRRRSCRW
jgi:transposase